MKKIILINGLLLCSVPFFGQSVMDAVNYTKTDIVGTARYMSMAGAFGALGGDITTLSHNPAGIGVYRSSEVVITGSIGGVETKTSTIQGNGYNGMGYNNSKFNIDANTLGYVGTYRTGNSDGLVSFNFGFSFNRKAGEKRRYKVTQNNMKNALSDYIADRANIWGGNAADLITSRTHDPYYDTSAPWLSILGYNGNIISNNGSNYEGLYMNENVDFGGDLFVDESKSIDEYTFNIGGNISNIVYWGVGLGVVDLDYKLKTYYDEYYWQAGNPGSYNSYANYKLDNYLDTHGTGLNVKMGLILRASNYLRFGFAVHTPTWYNMTDEFGAVLESSGVPNLDNTGTYAGKRVNSPSDYYDYKLQTPWKYQFSAAAVLGTVGILSAEYELSDYKTIKYKDPEGYDYPFEGVNNDISNQLRDLHSFKVGAEFRLTPEVSLRFGFANQWSAYEKNVLDNEVDMYPAGTIPSYVLARTTQSYTGCLGYRLGNLCVACSFVWRQNNQDAYLMPSASEDGTMYVSSSPTRLNTSSYKFVVTLGYKF